jgi:hypothetical protein
MTVQGLAVDHRIGIRLALLVLLAVVLPGRPAKAENDLVDVRTFVKRFYSESAPYAEARAYGVEAIPELVDMLNDPALEPHWSMIIFTMGAIGDPSARQPLLNFLTGLNGEISTHSFRAALGVPPALGMLANDGDDESLQVLLALADPANWQENQLDFRYQRYEEDVLGEVMGRMALQGLGLSARSEACSMLQSMSNNPDLREDWRDNVEEALSLCDQVEPAGLARTFERVAE